MDWASAKEHCKKRNWQWSLNLINAAQIEMEEKEKYIQKLESQLKAHRLYNSCNY